MRVQPIELSVDIDRDAGDVFAYVRDYSKQPEWQLDLVEVSHGPAGPVEVGTQLREKRKTPVGTQSYGVAITAVDEDGLVIRDRLVDGTLAGTAAEFRIEPRGDGSRLHFRLDVELGGFMATMARAGFIRSRMVRSTSDTWSKNLGRLAEILGGTR